MKAFLNILGKWSAFSILILLCSCATLEIFESADLAFVSGDLATARIEYQEMLKTKGLTAEQREHAMSRIREIGRKEAGNVMSVAMGFLGSPPTLQELEKAIHYLQENLAMDDDRNVLVNYLDRLNADLNEMRTRFSGLMAEQEAFISDHRWEDALKVLDELLPLTSDATEISTAKELLIKRRDRHYLHLIDTAILQKDLNEGKRILTEFAGLEPAPHRKLQQEADHRLAGLWEDLLPPRLDDLLRQKRYFEAYKLLNQSERMGTKNQYSFIAGDGARFYTQVAKSHKRAMPPDWGAAYFAIGAAEMLDKESSEIFTLKREITDRIDEQVNISIGISQFATSFGEAPVGKDFTNSLTVELADRMPYGISIIDHEVISQTKSGSKQEWDFFVNRRKVELLVNGNVSFNFVKKSVDIPITERTAPIAKTVSNEHYPHELEIWMRTPEKTRGPRPNPDKTIYVADEVQYMVTRESYSAEYNVDVRLIRPDSDSVHDSASFSEPSSKTDISHLAVPLLGKPSDESDLPAEHEVRNDLEDKIIAQAVDFISRRYRDRGSIFYADFEAQKSRREYTEAFNHLAHAHHFLSKDTKTGTVKTNLRRASLHFEEALVDLHEQLIQSLGDMQRMEMAPSIAGENAREGAVQAVMPPPADDFVEHYALIIGISDYNDNDIPDLRFPENDALAFYDWLMNESNLGFTEDNLKLLRNQEATTVEVRKAINGWLGTAQPQDSVTIYFAGHGSPASIDRPDDLFLLTHDTEFASIASTALPMEELYESLSKYVASENIRLFVDACHSGAVGTSFEEFRNIPGSRAVIPKRSADRLAKGAEILAPDVVTGPNLSKQMESLPASSGLNSGGPDKGRSLLIFSSANEDQLSQESEEWNGHGVFTHHLIRAIRGDADLNGDKVLTVGELSNFVIDQVRRSTNNAQEPTVFGTFTEEDPYIHF